MPAPPPTHQEVERRAHHDAGMHAKEQLELLVQHETQAVRSALPKPCQGQIWEERGCGRMLRCVGGPHVYLWTTQPPSPASLHTRPTNDGPGSTAGMCPASHPPTIHCLEVGALHQQGSGSTFQPGQAHAAVLV